MSEQSEPWAVKTVDAFLKYAAAGCSPRDCAAKALEVHEAESGMEGDAEIQIWHMICTLAAHSDARGFFRDQVFGPKQAGGPKLHKVVCGLRDLCAEKGLDFDGLYRDVCAHIETDPEAASAPSV